MWNGVGPWIPQDVEMQYTCPWQWLDDYHTVEDDVKADELEEYLDEQGVECYDCQDNGAEASTRCWMIYRYWEGRLCGEGESR